MWDDISVSIIMPSLNVADYIEQAVSSACNQTLKDIEIICIDAGSTDGTLETLRKIATEDNRIVLMESDRRSYGYQVNTGIDVARGKYIAILETDDFVSSDMYVSLYQNAEKWSCDFVKGDYIAFWTQRNGERYLIHRKAIQDNTLYDHVICPADHRELTTDDW